MSDQNIQQGDFSGDGETIVSVEERNVLFRAYHASEADMKLAAAAPDLVKALEISLKWLSSYPGGLALSAYEEARAALDKALR